MIISNFTRIELISYIQNQLNNFFPDNLKTKNILDENLNEALFRTFRCINGIQMWPKDIFDPMHSSQYCTFLYYLANTIWKNTGASNIPVKLFMLNKSLNGIDCFYEIELPEVFFIGHSVGIVLAKATYKNYFAIYQNATVGKNNGIAPTINEKVIMYGNTAIIGDCIIAPGSIISQGTSIIDSDTKPNLIAFRSNNFSTLSFREPKRSFLEDIFRLHDVL